jgi:hypothetical protein
VCFRLSTGEKAAFHREPPCETPAPAARKEVTKTTTTPSVSQCADMQPEALWLAGTALIGGRKFWSRQLQTRSASFFECAQRGEHCEGELGAPTRGQRSLRTSLMCVRHSTAAETPALAHTKSNSQCAARLAPSDQPATPRFVGS